MKDIERKVLNNIDQDKTVRTLQELVRIPSWVDYSRPEIQCERKRAEYLESRMKELGMDVIVAGEVQYGRPALIGFLRGSGQGQPGLFFDAHLDTTTPLDLETMPRPFDGQIENGEVKGLGAADQLQTMAAFLGAVDAIKKSKVQIDRDFMVIFPSDEMVGARGVELASRWMKENDIKPEFGIAGESTDNNIGIAHTGIVEFEIEVIGQASYPSFSTKEIAKPFASPVARMFEVGQALLRIDKEEERFKIEHPYVGTSYTWIGSIEGGTRHTGYGWSGAQFDPMEPGMVSYEAFHRHLAVSGSALPEYCKLRYGVRVIPKSLKPGEAFHVEPEEGFHTAEIQEMVNTHLKKLWKESPSDCTYKLRVTNDRSIPYEISPEEPNVKRMAKVIEDVTGKTPSLVGTKHWTEVSRITQQNGSTFVQVAPTWSRYLQPDEGCPITDLMTTTQIYTLAVLNFCGIA